MNKQNEKYTNFHKRPSVCGSCCKPQWESPPTLTMLVLSPHAATESSNRHLCLSGSLPTVQLLSLHIRDRGVSCEHFCPDPVFPCFTPSCSSRLIGLAGHLPAFIVQEVKDFRLDASLTATTACFSTMVQLRSLTKVIVLFS